METLMKGDGLSDCEKGGWVDATTTNERGRVRERMRGDEGTWGWYAA